MTPATFKTWRLARGLSQVAAGATLGVGRRTVQSWESGERRFPARLLALACAALDAGLDADLDAASDPVPLAPTPKSR